MTKLEEKLDQYYIALTGGSMADEKNPVIKKVFINQAKKVCVLSIRSHLSLIDHIANQITNKSFSDLREQYKKRIIEIENYETE